MANEKKDPLVGKMEKRVQTDHSIKDREGNVHQWTMIAQKRDDAA